jgi:glycosyltransferase involved in cell wall biosynthesis
MTGQKGDLNPFFRSQTQMINTDISKPKVSIIISAFNAASYLAYALTSVENQKYKNFEIVIVQNGSSDDTIDIINSFSNIYGNIQVINLQVNVGLYKAREMAYAKSIGEFCLNIDADDAISPNFLEESMAFIIKNNLDMSIGKIVITDNEMNPTDSDENTFGNDNVIINDRNCFQLLKNRYGSWSKIIKREYLIKHNYHYDVEKELGLFCFPFFDDCKSGYCPNAQYFYRASKTSVSRDVSKAASFNSNPSNSAIYFFDLGPNVTNRKKKNRLEMYLVKSAVPIILFRSVGDRNFKWRKEVNKLKRHYQYNFLKMISSLSLFSKRTKIISAAIAFHMIWLMRLYLIRKSKK